MQINMYITLYYNYIFLLLQNHKLYINTHLSVLIPIVPKYLKFLLISCFWLIWCRSSPVVSSLVLSAYWLTTAFLFIQLKQEVVIYCIKLRVSLLSNKYQHIHEEWKYLEDLMQQKEAGAMTLKSDEIVWWSGIQQCCYQYSS